MTNLQLLNNIDHFDVKIDATLRESYGDNVGGCLVFPSEFIALQKEFPIVLQKEESGEFQFIAIFGFKDGENLFLSESGWLAKYTPLIMNKGPFVIGFQNQHGDAANDKNPVVHIDMNSPRINDKGSAVFYDKGGFTPFLENVKKNLTSIHYGLSDAKKLISILVQYDLIENFTIDAQFDNGEAIKLDDFYTINIENLYELDAGIVSSLHQKGFLQLIYAINFSFSNITRLVKMKNDKG